MKKNKKISTQIEINAAPEKIWNILMDFNKYSTWNPFVLEISGEQKPDSKLNVLLKLPHLKPINIKPKVLKVVENREFRWIGHLLLPGLFDGEHIFEIIRKNGKTVFIHHEKFKGIFSALILKKIAKNTKSGFELMNAALKEFAEKN